ncbi:MAG: hypothetical protein C4325_09815, partial [Blastocatellia bacterium]
AVKEYSKSGKAAIRSDADRTDNATDRNDGRWLASRRKFICPFYQIERTRNTLPRRRAILTDRVSAFRQNLSRFIDEFCH